MMNTTTHEPLSKESLSALYSMAYQLYRNGKYADAREFFRLLSNADPHDRRYWMGLGACYQMAKEYPEAIECYSVAAIQDPNDPYVHFYAAECFRHSDKMDTALKTLESALTVAKESKEKALVTKLEHVYEAWSPQSKGAHHG